MKLTKTKRNALVLLMCLLVALAAVGCSGGASNASKEGQENRQYMSQLNQSMEELNARLDSFVDAVSRGDVVNMKSQAANAYKVLDKVESLDAPEALADVKKKYVEGSKKLREALDAYIALYTEASAATGKEFDWTSFDKRVAEIQKTYDEGVKTLEEGDKVAADLK